ncbi:MAG TPA: hypothetical protein PKY81_12250 [bacterium]|nr:hypothetical protein [bacterium]
MVQFIAIDPQMMVNGETVLSIVNGMGAFKTKALAILSENGIDNPVSGKWYLQQSWLNSFKKISEKLGASALFSIGKSIPENAKFPAEIDNIEKALAAIDIAYHMNHGKNGIPLFDAKTGRMSEGIGHYGYQKISDKKVKMVCNNPYPCEFDRGIIEAMARRFKPAGAIMLTVMHDDSQPCRKKGNESCSYIVSW